MIIRIFSKVRSVQGLITVPGVLALFIWTAAWPLLTLDTHYNLINNRPFDGRLAVNYETAISVLGTISAAAMTTLSLVYSIVLVVFTLAAGNIAPRLLQRFTKDRVNQITAGLLGGTFLFSLSVLHQTSPDFIPSISITVAFALAAMTVLQLIYFVHTVSRSVTIDEEVASISQRLADRLSRIVVDDEGNTSEIPEIESNDCHWVTAPRSGYVTYLDMEPVSKAAEKANTIVRITVKPGSFVLSGQRFGCVSNNMIDEDHADALYVAIQESCTFEPSRGSQDDVEYTVNLLIEIALRALSPGVNDTFTAIASTDRLSAAFQSIVERGLRDRVLKDGNDQIRVVMEGFSVDDLLNTAFSPLRRAAGGNALMMKHLGDALARLHDVASETTKPTLVTHLKLLVDEFALTEPLDTDLQFLKDRFRHYL